MMTKEEAKQFISQVEFKKSGLVPAIAQENGRVLMLAYMNKEALMRTLTSRRMTYYSRSRKKLWRKGDTSGNTQTWLSVSPDCDNDALLFEVRQKGPACHTGSKSCFIPPFSLADLEDRIASRRRNDKGSYTAKLLRNKKLLNSKLREESEELIEAAEEKNKSEVIWEAADLIYHTFVLLRKRRVSLADVQKELKRRAKTIRP